MSTISPNQRRAALMNSSTAKKAMRLAAMLATSPTDAAAPLLAASRMFCSSLHGKRPQLGSRGQASTCVSPGCPRTGRMCGASVHHPSPHTHPRERRMLALPLNLDSSTSGQTSLDMARAQGAAITEAAISDAGSICNVQTVGLVTSVQGSAS